MNIATTLDFSETKKMDFHCYESYYCCGYDFYLFFFFFFYHKKMAICNLNDLQCA
jgi:hypothetical protein